MSELTIKTYNSVVWTASSSVITGALQAISLIIFARNITPSDYGIAGLTMVILGFLLAYSDAGISGLIIHLQKISKNQLSTFFYFTCLIGIFLCLCMEFSIPILVKIFNCKELVPILRISALVVLPLSACKITESLLQKELRFKTLALSDIVSSVVSFVIAVIMIISGMGMWAVILSFVIGNSFRAIMILILGIPVFTPNLSFSWKELTRQNTSFGLFQLGERTVNYFLERFDQFLIGKLGTPAMLGSYSIAFNSVVQSLNRVNPILLRVAFPAFAIIQNDKQLLKRGYFSTVRFLSIINAAMLIGFVTVSETAVPLIFSNRWNDSIPLFQILSIVVFLRCIGNPSGALLVSQGKANIGFYWNLFFMLISIPLLIAGFLLYKAAGVALALLVLQIILFYPFYIVCIKKIIGNCFIEYIKVAFVPVIPAIISGCIYFEMFKQVNLVFMILKLLLFEITYFCLLLLFCRDERNFIINKFNNRKKNKADNELHTDAVPSETL